MYLSSADKLLETAVEGQEETTHNNSCNCHVAKKKPMFIAGIIY